MVYFAPLIGAAALASVVAAVPMPQYGSSSSSNGYNSGNQYSSSSNQGYSTSTEDSTSTAYNSYSTSTYSSQYSTSTDAATYTSSSSYSEPSYGSGSSYWGGASYDDCVQQCMADYGGGMSSVSNTYTGSTADAGSSGTNGATHTVMVAPTAGVYRFVPFYTNASVGDTIQFVWGSSEHTVTKSSALELCNKTSEAPVFASGEQNQGFIYNQVVNDTNPIFYYCGTPGHCEKGMFGMINANTSTTSGSSSSSVASMLPQMMMNNSVLSAMYAYQQNVSNGNTMADNWGSNIDMSNMPSWSMEYVAQNVLYSRTFLAANPEVMQADGTINMSNAQTIAIPKDLAAQLSAASAAQGAPSSSSAPSSTAASTSPSTSTSAHSGAGSVTAPRLAAAIAAVAVTVFAL